MVVVAAGMKFIERQETTAVVVLQRGRRCWVDAGIIQKKRTSSSVAWVGCQSW
jgi:hypothetical protein